MTTRAQLFTLKGPEMLDPFWFNMMRGATQHGVVGEDASITIDGVSLKFKDECPTPGSAVNVWLDGRGYFVCATVDELQRAAKERERVATVERDRLRFRLNAMRSKAEAFNARLNVPVSWNVAIKVVLSGLGSASMGDGRYANTVEHVHLLEPLVEGRLVRAKGDLLCTPISGTKAPRWSISLSPDLVDGDGIAFQPKVTCKRCEAWAQRWSASSGRAVELNSEASA